jgi:peptidoglycan/xylan/chitin deacetylase (PgdA/CDA1 family)
MYWLSRSRGNDLFRTNTKILIHGNRDIPEIALTFDDGPHPESRGTILDILTREHIHATFFDVGINMAAHPDLVEKTISQGSEIGNHSQDHMSRLDVIDERHRYNEINDVDITYASITGKHLSLLRPPGMRFNDAVIRDTRDLGYIVVGYTTASRDFDPNEKPHDIAERTLSRVENGSIVLLHDYAATAAALPDILSGIKARGLRCVTISEMLSHLPDTPRRDVESFQRANSE